MNSQLSLRLENEKINVIIKFLVVCQIFSFFAAFLLIFIFDYPRLGIVNLTLFLLWTLCRFLYAQKKNNIAEVLFVVTTNLSVLVFAYAYGFTCGWYLYFFTIPLALFVFLKTESSLDRILVLSIYLTNFIFEFYYFTLKATPPILTIPKIYIELIFIINIVNSYYMVYILVKFYIKLDLIRQDEYKSIFMNNKKLEDEYRQLDLFNFVISHNLKGPLNRIKTLTEFLRFDKTLSPEDTEHSLIHLHNSATSLTETVGDLNLILSQRKTAAQAKEYFNVFSLLDEVKLSLAEEIKNTDVDFELDIEVPFINSIKSVWLSILHNLMSNSLKYRKADVTLHIRINIYKSDKDLILKFADNGLGIDMNKHKDKVFGIYNRFHKDIKGKGIGLFLIKNHISLLGGTIEVESKPDEGAEFMVVIPE